MGFSQSYKAYQGTGSLEWENHIYWNTQWGQNNKFSFLNISHQFGDQINWNYDAYGKLWTYNLNYFDWLHQEKITEGEGLALILDYCSSYEKLKDGLEPYPTSLRLINWVKFLGIHSYSSKVIDQTIYNDATRLLNNLEYHLLANHLLENAFALIFAGVYLKDKSILKKGVKLLQNELRIQILEDGAHYELSPMYHQLMLYRVLDTIQLFRKNSGTEDIYLLNLLEDKASKMISWLHNISFSNGDFPLFNDSTFGINPATSDLIRYANKLSIQSSKTSLGSSGYRKLNNKNFDLVADVGNIQPSYQPGHAHADNLSFVLYKGLAPFIVDRGVSTYEKNSKRQEERSTLAHNTVSIDQMNSSDVWAGFRVGNRAITTIITDESKELKASHDGYKKLGVNHERSWSINNKEIRIVDKITGKSKTAKAYFHLHPSVDILNVSKVGVNTTLGNLSFTNCSEIVTSKYDYARSFNKIEKSNRISVTFDHSLTTTININ